MSVQAMAWVLERSQARLGDRLVLLAIANHARADGTGAWPGTTQIGREAGLTKRQVFRCLDRLEALGELAIARGEGPHGTHLYTVTGLSTPVENPGQGGDKLSPGGVTNTTAGGDKLSGGVTSAPTEPSLEPSFSRPKDETSSASGRPVENGKANKPSTLTHDQIYLATRLRENVPGWLGLTNPGIGKLNQRFGSTVVRMALGRAREEEVPAATSAFRLLESICIAVLEEGT